MQIGDSKKQICNCPPCNIQILIFAFQNFFECCFCQILRCYTCIVTRPGDNLEHRESFILGRGVYRPAFNSLIERGFRVELSTDYDNGREWGTIYNCCGGRTFLDVSVNASDERVAEITVEMENEPSFYSPTRLFSLR